jgi:putative DNA primase/helicase
MLDALDQFREAMTLRGLIPPVDLLADGKLYRCNVEGRGGESDGAYLLHLDGFPAGGFENHKDGLGWENWRMDQGRAMTEDEKKAHHAHVEAMRKEREAEDRKRKAEARGRAKKIWDSAPPCVEHPYLTKKRIKAYRLRIAPLGFHQGDLVVPMWDVDGKLHSLQFIDADGGKMFLPGGKLKGCYFSMGKVAGVLYVAEGLATAASIHEATGQAVAVAFSAGNLQPVAQALRAKFPSLDLVICADDDYRTDGNPGRTKAMEAAQAVNGRVVLPIFGDNRPEKATDFNDLHQAQGLEAVRRCIEDRADHGAIPPAPGPVPSGPGSETDPPGWPEPQPLASKVEPEPYPLDALPECIRAAVLEVLGFVQAPIPLVASSALAALSLAIQAHHDMKRAEKLSGPVGLFLLTIADSGERKSTCDGFFTQEIHRYEAEQAEAAKPHLKCYRAALDAWEAKGSGIKDGIRAGAKAGKDTQPLEEKLRDLEMDKPEPPRVPRLTYGDATPESLKWSLAKVWPSGGVVSSEAGSVFGAHGMNKESIMRNLATFDQLWDGADIATERRSTESFTVRGARLTIALQVQEATLRTFLDQSGELARGIGFLARCLVAWPESTIGWRPFKESSDAWPCLGAFNRRIASILNFEAPIDEDGALTPAMLTFTANAKAEWVAFHDRTERELRDGGKFHDVKDVASKIADNAARMAALFHVFEGAAGAAVGVGSFQAAARIAEWHLNEARRFFGELALPSGLADAARLETWVIDRCKRNGTTRVPNMEIQQYGPRGIRTKAEIEDALTVLQELGRAQRVTEGRGKFIAVNPALLASMHVAIAIPAIPAIQKAPEGWDPLRNSQNSQNSNSNPSKPEKVDEPLALVSGADWNSSIPVEV